MKCLPYDPGIIPTKPSPIAGEKIMIKVSGYPPYKDEHFSMRNPRHPNYKAFVRLREAAIAAMNGRAWFFGPVAMNVALSAPSFEEGKTLLDYVSGIEDTLDGSSGCEFTYLPIVFEDDCQVCDGRIRFIKTENIFYEVEIEFMSNQLNRTNTEPIC
jgi:hypothetical protein